MFCYHCGKEISDAARFCPYCGVLLFEETTQENESLPVEETSASSEQAEEPAKKKTPLQKLLIAVVVLAILAGLGFGGKYTYDEYIYPYLRYEEAAKLTAEQDYPGAIAIYKELGEYKDAKSLLVENIYLYGIRLQGQEAYEEAIRQYELAGDYKDCKDRIPECRYEIALDVYEQPDYAKARELFLELDPYKNTGELITDCDYNLAIAVFDAGDFAKASEDFLVLGSYKEAHTYYLKSIYEIAKAERENGELHKSLDHLELLMAENFQDSRAYARSMADDLAQYYVTCAETDGDEAKWSLNYLYEFGYFTYKPLLTENKEAMLDLVEPVSFSIYKGDGNNYSFGTGMIYRITPDYMYCLSVRHVVRVMANSKVKLTFYDGTKVYTTMHPVYSQENSKLDFAMFRVPLELIPPEILITLREAYVDLSVYERLTKGTKLVIHANMWGGNTDKIHDTEYLGNDVASMTHGYDSDPYGDFIVCTNDAVGGQSGGPIFTLKGELVALVDFTYWEKTSSGRYSVDCQVKVNRAEELYKLCQEQTE
ncbi:MAG: trypsin-like peptidase domain-containing protein [Lachnospiraceae bacterium]|nr:trypsin-like peptidase domain-containing protein [Lachnospiraceae bacterium]